MLLLFQITVDVLSENTRVFGRGVRGPGDLGSAPTEAERRPTPLRSTHNGLCKNAEMPYLCNVINLVTMTRNIDFGSSLDFVFITSKVLFLLFDIMITTAIGGLWA